MTMPGKTYLLGIDLGTTSIKGMLLSNKGELVTIRREEYLLEYGPNDKCELDPEIYWEVTCRIIKSLILESKIEKSLIKGLAFSSQGETLIPVDSNGRPLRKAIVWLDNRSTDEAREITEKFGNQHIMNATGQPEVQAIWPATRILWLKKHEPQIYTKVYKYLLVEDYLIYRLTGSFFTEYSLVSSTLYFDIRQKTWWGEMMDYVGLTPQQLPVLKPSGYKVGILTGKAAVETGLPNTVEVITGAYDHPAGAIGAGNYSPGMVTLTIGASMALCVTTKNPVNDLSIRLSCQCHAVNNLYFLLPYAQTAGLILRWFKDTFCQAETENAEKSESDVYDILSSYAEKIPAGSEGLMLLPHFAGAGSPYFDQTVKGVFAGITAGMGKGHFVRSIMEAVAAVIHHNLETLNKFEIPVSEIRFLGGGSKSPLWCQIIADMTGIPVITMNKSENAAMGAAILAGLGTEIFPDLESAGKICVSGDKIYVPENRNFNIYKTVYLRYKSLYKSLSGYWQ